jgi:hypothetical protein
MNKKALDYGFLAVILALAITACKQPSEPDIVYVYVPESTPTPEHVHEWGEWIVTTAPTATKNGVETRICKLDSAHTELQAIAPTGIKINPTVSWPQGLTAFYGQTLSDISLASYTNGGSGMFTWATINASVGNVGEQSHSMTFTPNDTADYHTLTQNVNITVNKANITDVELTITGPVKGAAPVAAAATDDANYTCGAVSWNPNNNPFLGGTVYAATVTLTADSSYTFAHLSAATINGINANISNNTGGTVTLSHTFPVTDTRTATGIALKTQPANLIYTHGDPLDLTGLVVTLTYDDTTTEDVAASGFADKNITINPANGAHLIHSTYNGHLITIIYGDLPQLTSGSLTVNKAPGVFAGHVTINTTYTSTLTLAALNAQIANGYAWVTPSTSLNAGNNQSFAATYTNPDGNHESANGTITVNVAKAAGSFAAHAAINVTYTSGLTLAGLNTQLSTGYAWVTPSTSLSAGNGQSFAAAYTNPNGNYEVVTGTITVNVAKATGANVGAPTPNFTTHNSVTINPVTASTGQTVEYARNSTNAAPSTGWQNGPTFGNLSAGTTYYFFARSVGNGNYETGAPSAGAAIATKQQAGDDTIITYWVDDTGELSVGGGGQGNTVTVSNGGSVTFTANGAGYSNQSWTLNGNTVGSGASYTFNTADNDKEMGRNYIIGLRVQKDGRFYFTEIIVKVVE